MMTGVPFSHKRRPAPSVWTPRTHEGATRRSGGGHNATHVGVGVAEPTTGGGDEVGDMGTVGVGVGVGGAHVGVGVRVSVGVCVGGLVGVEVGGW